MLKSGKMRKATWQQVPKHISNLYTSLHPPYTLFGIWNHHLIPGLLKLWSPNWCLPYILGPELISTFHPEWTFQNANLITPPKTLHNLILAISFMFHDTHTLLTFYSSDMPTHIFYPKICPLPLSFTWNRLQLTALNPCPNSSSYKFLYRPPFPRKIFWNPSIVSQQPPYPVPATILSQTHALFSPFTAFYSSCLHIIYLYVCLYNICLFHWTLSSIRAAIKMMSVGFIYQNVIHI